MKSLREISCNVKKLSNILTRSMLGRIFLKSVLLQSHSQITINLSLVVVVVFFTFVNYFPTYTMSRLFIFLYLLFVANLQTVKSVGIMYVTFFHLYQDL